MLSLWDTFLFIQSLKGHPGYNYFSFKSNKQPRVLSLISNALACCSFENVLWRNTFLLFVFFTSLIPGTFLFFRSITSVVNVAELLSSFFLQNEHN